MEAIRAAASLKVIKVSWGLCRSHCSRTEHCDTSGCGSGLWKQTLPPPPLHLPDPPSFSRTNWSFNWQGLSLCVSLCVCALRVLESIFKFDLCATVCVFSFVFVHFPSSSPHTPTCGIKFGSLRASVSVCEGDSELAKCDWWLKKKKNLRTKKRGGGGSCILCFPKCHNVPEHYFESLVFLWWSKPEKSNYERAFPGSPSLAFRHQCRRRADLQISNFSVQTLAFWLVSSQALNPFQSLPPWNFSPGPKGKRKTPSFSPTSRNVTSLARWPRCTVLLSAELMGEIHSTDRWSHCRAIYALCSLLCQRVE